MATMKQTSENNFSLLANLYLSLLFSPRETFVNFPVSKVTRRGRGLEKLLDGRHKLLTSRFGNFSFAQLGIQMRVGNNMLVTCHIHAICQGIDNVIVQVLFKIFKYGATFIH